MTTMTEGRWIIVQCETSIQSEQQVWLVTTSERQRKRRQASVSEQSSAADDGRRATAQGEDEGL